MTEEPVKVYNFEVEDFHTYHVGCFYVLVHNADYNQSPKEIMAERTKGLDTREHPSKYKQISAKEKSRLESKVRDRTITKDEYKKLEWNKKISAKRQDAVNEFWDQEQIRLQKGENGTRNWSPQQKADILNGKRPTYNGKTIQGHHTYSVSKYPHLSGNSEVIYPATFNEHLKGWHCGNFRNSLPVEPIRTIIDFKEITMRTVGLKLESSVFTATVAKIIRKYQELSISQIKQIVSNNDYVYKCDIIRANGIKTLLHVKEDLSREGINSCIYVEGQPTSEEYLNNLLVSYKQTEEQVEEEMDREALLECDE